MTRRLVALAAISVLLVGCGDDAEHASAPDTAPAPESLTITSTAFDDGDPIPEQYTCQGDGISPPLEWSGVNGDRVGSLALVVDDPDAAAGGYVHWIVFGLSTGRGAIDEGKLPDEAREVPASDGPDWQPPCPPSGTHHNRFTRYAFPSDSAWAVREDTPLQELLDLIADESIAWGRLTGTVAASGGDSGGGY